MDNLLKYLKKPEESDQAGAENKEILTAKISVSSNVGFVRDHNEDNYYADELGIRTEENEKLSGELKLDKRRIFAVCDGMGGEDYGEVASLLSVKVLSLYEDKIRDVPQSEMNETINRYAAAANNEICEMVRQRHAHASGSTLAMVCIDNNEASVYNIGDSRVYIMKNNVLTQVTEDQTLALKKLRANIYTEEEAKNSPDAHTITSFLGVDNRGIGPKAIPSGTFATESMTFMICSDGLTDMCEDDEILDILVHELDDPAEALVERALEHGGVDNTTCVVIRI
ncbi:MAG: serine/threonine-protein phosphatase [Clostridia bacterium]|nr:serine/threonine-protein phosphatase [Clostridia bacterium]